MVTINDRNEQTFIAGLWGINAWIGWNSGQPDNHLGIQDFGVLNFDGRNSWDDRETFDTFGIIEIAAIPTLQFSQPTFSVKEDGTPVKQVTVTRTGYKNNNLSATVQLTDGTATANDDYNNRAITVNFNRGGNGLAFDGVNDTVDNHKFLPNLTDTFTIEF